MTCRPTHWRYSRATLRNSPNEICFWLLRGLVRCYIWHACRQADPGAWNHGTWAHEAVCRHAMINGTTPQQSVPCWSRAKLNSTRVNLLSKISSWSHRRIVVGFICQRDLEFSISVGIRNTRVKITTLCLCWFAALQYDSERNCKKFDSKSWVLLSFLSSLSVP